MAKPKPIQISIPKPCSENWDEMIPSGQGRFCDHCQKTVTDFTGWSDAALYKFLTQNKATKICGRLRREQLIKPVVPYQPQSKLYQLFIGLGLTLIFIQVPTSNVGASNLYSYSVCLEKDNEENTIDDIILTGIVLSIDSLPIHNAIIQLFDNNAIVASTITNTDGKFKIGVDSNKLSDQSHIVISYQDYDKHQIKLSSVDLSKEIQINYELFTTIYSEVIQGMMIRTVTPFEYGTNRTYSSDEIEKIPH